MLSQKDKFDELSKIADMMIEVVYYGYKDQMWGINLEKDTINKLSSLNLSIDIALYASGPDLYKD